MQKTTLFRLLNAKLKNDRWAWGGVRANGSVVLLVWADEDRTNADGTKSYMVKAPDDLTSQGAVDRLAHIDMIHNGAPCLLAIALDASAGNHESIKDIRTDYLFRGGELETDPDGTQWIRRGERVSLADARREI